MKSYDVSALSEALPLVEKFDEICQGEPLERVAIALMMVSASVIRETKTTPEQWTKDLETMGALAELGRRREG